MPTTLIVFAHPNPRSFNGAWSDASAEGCARLGHTVLRSDLYALGFNSPEGADHYAQAATGFDPLKAQETASRTGALPKDVQAEIDKILRADRIVFHFPMWWFSPPAILQGWCERVLAHGALHTVDERFDTGRCRGKTALFCVTTGAAECECAFDGKEGDVGMLLWPLAYTLRYLGFDVLAPKTAHGVHGYHEGQADRNLREQLGQVLTNQVALMRDARTPVF